MLRTSLCDFSEAYIILKGRVTVLARATAAPNPRTAEQKDSNLHHRVGGTNQIFVQWDHCLWNQEGHTWNPYHSRGP